MSFYKDIMEGSLPTTVKQINSPKLKKAKPDPKSKRAKEIRRTRRLYKMSAEFSTYDFDDDDYEVDGGMQKRKNTQKRGYEPVENIVINGQKYKRVS